MHSVENGGERGRANRARLKTALPPILSRNGGPIGNLARIASAPDNLRGRTNTGTVQTLRLKIETGYYL